MYSFFRGCVAQCIKAVDVSLYRDTIREEQLCQPFPVIYGEDAASIEIETGIIIDGYLPGKALSMTREWMELHRQELSEIWDTQEFKSIPPLE